MPLNSGLNSYLTCLEYLSYLAKLLDHKTMNLASYCTYLNDKKLNVKLYNAYFTYFSRNFRPRKNRE